MGIPVTDATTKIALCQEKNGLLGISLGSTIPALRNETIWPGFLWYLAGPPGKDYVQNTFTTT